MTSEPKSRPDSLASRILDAMEPGVRYARADLIDELGVSVAEWKQAVAELVEREAILRTGSRRGTRYELVADANDGATEGNGTALSSDARTVFEAMAPATEYARKDLLDSTGLSVSAWNRVIAELLDQGIVVREGERSMTRYRLATEAAAESSPPAAETTTEPPAPPASPAPDRTPQTEPAPTPTAASSRPTRERGRFEATIDTIREQLGLDDSVRVEALLGATGVPVQLWSTLSALANSGREGAVILGARRRSPDVCYVKGVRKPLILVQRLRRMFTDNQILRGIDVDELELEVVELAHRKVIALRLREREPSNVRPVYVGDNAYSRLPEEGTFTFDGDTLRKCTPEEIDAMWDAWAAPHKISRFDDDTPSIEDLDEDGPIVDTLLREIAGPARRHPSLADQRLEECIVRACGVRPLSLDELSELLDRKASRLQREELEHLLELKRLVRVKGLYCVHSTQVSRN